VAGVPVATSLSTRFEGGLATDLSNDVQVEAEGVWTGTVLSATKIEFKRSVIRVQGVVTASTAPTFTLNVAGGPVSVETDSFTSGSIPPIGLNCVLVRGQRKAVGGLVVTAREIGNCGDGDRPVMQAPVEGESGTTLTLLGFPIDVGTPTDSPPYVDVNNQPLTQAQFFAAVSPANPGPPAVAGTLVKIIFSANGNDVNQVELEN